jgi:hypothetical protein
MASEYRTVAFLRPLRPVLVRVPTLAPWLVYAWLCCRVCPADGIDLGAAHERADGPESLPHPQYPYGLLACPHSPYVTLFLFYPSSCSDISISVSPSGLPRLERRSCGRVYPHPESQLGNVPSWPCRHVCSSRSGCLRPLNTACHIRALVCLGFDGSKLLTGP